MDMLGICFRLFFEIKFKTIDSFYQLITTGFNPWILLER